MEIVGLRIGEYQGNQKCMKTLYQKPQYSQCAANAKKDLKEIFAFVERQGSCSLMHTFVMKPKPKIVKTASIKIMKVVTTRSKETSRYVDF